MYMVKILKNWKHRINSHSNQWSHWQLSLHTFRQMKHHWVWKRTKIQKLCQKRPNFPRPTPGIGCNECGHSLRRVRWVPRSSDSSSWCAGSAMRSHRVPKTEKFGIFFRKKIVDQPPYPHICKSHRWHNNDDRKDASTRGIGAFSAKNLLKKNKI